MSSVVKFQFFKSQVGELKIGSFENKLCLCDWRYRKQRDAIDQRISKHLNANFAEETTPIIEETIKQLEHYFDTGLQNFTIPLLLAGTNFQKSVWQTLIKIPYGTTKSYSQLAEQMKNPLGIRAIATANGANAISIIIPCHRIIGSDGSLVGYAGGLKAKKQLLLLEGAIRDAQLKLL